MSNINKCADCPCIGMPYACPAKFLPHPRYCDHAKTKHPAYCDLMVTQCKDEKIDITIDKTLYMNQFNINPNDINSYRIGLFFNKVEPLYVNFIKSILVKNRLTITAIGFLEGTLNPNELGDSHGIWFISSDKCKYAANHCSINIIVGITNYNDILSGGYSGYIIAGDKSIGYEDEIVSLDELSLRWNKSIQDRILKIEKITPPSLLKKMGSLTMALIGRAMDGSAPSSVEENRLSICKRCDYYNDHGNCNICGCNVGLKVKFAAESCPKNHWGAYEPINIGEIPKTGGCNCGS